MTQIQIRKLVVETPQGLLYSGKETERWCTARNEGQHIVLQVAREDVKALTKAIGHTPLIHNKNIHVPDEETRPRVMFGKHSAARLRKLYQKKLDTTCTLGHNENYVINMRVGDAPGTFIIWKQEIDVEHHAEDGMRGSQGTRPIYISDFDVINRGLKLLHVKRPDTMEKDLATGLPQTAPLLRGGTHLTPDNREDIFSDLPGTRYTIDYSIPRKPVPLHTDSVKKDLIYKSI